MASDGNIIALLWCMSKNSTFEYLSVQVIPREIHFEKINILCTLRSSR